MIGQGMHGFVGNDSVEFEDLDHELAHPTDLRVFGGDGGGWYEWSHHASTNLIIWESDDLLHWSEPRMLDVSRKPDGSHLELGMAWACECLWVPDYYPQGHHGGRGAFVMYWSSTVFRRRG